MYGKCQSKQHKAIYEAPASEACPLNPLYFVKIPSGLKPWSLGLVHQHHQVTKSQKGAQDTQQEVHIVLPKYKIAEFNPYPNTLDIMSTKPKTD